MKPYDILDALGEIDTDLLAACEDYTQARIARRKTLMRCAAGVCAVLLFAVGIGTPLLRRMASNDTAAQDTADATLLMTDVVDDHIEVTVQSSKSEQEAEDMTAAVPPSEDEVQKNVSEYSYTDPSKDPSLKIEAEQLPVTSPALDAAPEEEVEWDAPSDNTVPEEEVEFDAPAADESPSVDEAPDIPAGEDERYTDKTLSVESTAESAELPMLSVSFGFAGYGYKTHIIYDGEALVNYNLLDEYGTPETLPVYKNLAITEPGGGWSAYLDDETMLRMGQDYAAFFGYEVLDYDTNWASDEEDVPGDVMWLDTPYAEIIVEGNGETIIRFKKEKALAANGSLSEKADIGVAEKTLARLSELYVNLIGGKYMQYDIRHSRMSDGSPIRTYSVFSVSDDARTTYLNASFGYVTFRQGGNGGLGSLLIKNGLCALEMIGDYPLISEEEATKRLLDGYYLTTIPDEYLGTDGITEHKILSCELTYRGTNTDPYDLPYYCFYVHLENEERQANGLETYGEYWVPAVHPDYLDPDTVWDGRGN